MQTNALAETAVTDTTNEPQPEAPEQEATAVVPAEPEVIEGEVIAIEQPETTDAHLPTQQKPYWMCIPLTILFCLLIVAASFLLPLFTPTATITIIPVARSISLTTVIRVHARLVPALTLSQSASVMATGIRQQRATRAVGTLTLYNGLLTSQTIAAGTVLTGTDGVQIITDRAAVIPAGQPPMYGHVSVSAHAVFAGPQGNIPAFTINTACCATSVVAKNTSAFSGGAAAREYRVVTKTDIKSAVTLLLGTLSRSEDAALHAQLHTGEALLPPSCTPHVISDHRPGDEAQYVSVTVAVACTGSAYYAHEVDAEATHALTSQAFSPPGTAYSRIGDIQVTLVHAAITGHTQGVATLALKIDATYLYQIRPSEQERLSTLLAGKSKQQAITTLLQYPGIQDAAIHLAGGTTTLPTDPHHIQVIVLYRGS